MSAAHWGEARRSGGSPRPPLHGSTTHRQCARPRRGGEGLPCPQFPASARRERLAVHHRRRRPVGRRQPWLTARPVVLPGGARSREPLGERDTGPEAPKSTWSRSDLRFTPDSRQPRSEAPTTRAARIGRNTLSGERSVSISLRRDSRAIAVPSHGQQVGPTAWCNPGTVLVRPLTAVYPVTSRARRFHRE